MLPLQRLSGVRHSPSPDRPSMGRAAGARGPVFFDAGVWAPGPVTNPTAHYLASWRCAPWGQQQDVPRGGGGECFREGCPALGTVPSPTGRPWGVPPGPAAFCLRVRGVRVWEPVTNPTAHALAS